jgi:hypothetical protein
MEKTFLRVERDLDAGQAPQLLPDRGRFRPAGPERRRQGRPRPQQHAHARSPARVGEGVLDGRARLAGEREVRFDVPSRDVDVVARSGYRLGHRAERLLAVDEDPERGPAARR